MTWAYTELITGNSGAAVSITTASFTPVANSVIHIVVASKASSGRGVGIRCADYSFYQAQNFNGAYSTDISLTHAFALSGASPTSTTVTLVFDRSGSVGIDAAYWIGSWTGQDTGRVPAPWSQLRLTGDETPASVASITTASVAPLANRLLTLCVRSKIAGGSAPNTPTVTGLGLTWVTAKTVNLTSAGGSSTLTVLDAVTGGSAPTPGALTIDFGGQTQLYAQYFVHAWSGHDTSKTETTVIQQTGASYNTALSQNKADNMTLSVLAGRAGTGYGFVDTAWSYLDKADNGSTPGMIEAAWSVADDTPSWLTTLSSPFGCEVEFVAATSSTPRSVVQTGTHTASGVTTSTVTLAAFSQANDLAISTIGASSQSGFSPTAPLTEITDVSTNMIYALGYYEGDLDPTWTFTSRTVAHAALELWGVNSISGMALINNGYTIFAPTLVAAGLITPGLISNGYTIYAPASITGPSPIYPGLIDRTGVVYAPSSISAGINMNYLDAGFINNGYTIYPPQSVGTSGIGQVRDVDEYYLYRGYVSRWDDGPMRRQNGPLETRP